MIEKIYTTEEIKKILIRILDKEPVYSVILFGYYAKNCATKDSDLDFIIDTKDSLKGFKLFSLITKIEEAFRKKVDVLKRRKLLKIQSLIMKLK